MKKTLLTVFVSCLMISVSAQNFVGLKAGGGLALRSGSSTFTSLSGTAIFGGLSYKHQIFERVTCEGDILFDIRGTQAELPDGSAIANGGTYVSVPLTIQWMTPFKKRELVPYRTGQPNAYWYVEGGPYFAYGLSVDAYDPTGTPEGKAFDLGLTGGIGMNFGFEGTMSRLSVGARANYGLMNTYPAYTGGPVLKNLNAVGFLGWDFSLTKRRHIKYRW